MEPHNESNQEEGANAKTPEIEETNPNGHDFIK
jgi:hypothetical protein